MALPDSGSAPIIALLVVAGLAFATRWVFKSSRPKRAEHPVDATDARELGLLSVIATVNRTEALAQRAQLGQVGIRSSQSRRSDGRVDLLVFHADVEAARRVLGH